MLRRWCFGLVLSVLAHAAVVAVGLALGARGLGGPVEIELADGQVTEVKDFPLGAPETGATATPRAHARPRSRAPKVAADVGTLAERADDEKPKAGSSPIGDEAAPAPTNDLGAYGPAGSRLTVLMRLDRLRGTEYQSAVDDLLLHLPDRRELLQGTGLDLFADFDALLIATPNPRDPKVTFLAVRHHLEQGKLRAALTRGAKSTDHKLVWRRQAGRLVGERQAPKDSASTSVPLGDDRLVVLFDPGSFGAPDAPPALGLAVVTPPTYRALLLGPEDPAGGWAMLLSRIGAEEGLMPEGGVVMMKAVDLLKPMGSWSGANPTLYGLELPPAASATIGIDDGPFVDVEAAFKTEDPARHWETEWPLLQRRLRTHPYAILSGFSALVSRATLTRAGTLVRLHVPVTRDETTRLLSFALQILASRGL